MEHQLNFSFYENGNTKSFVFVDESFYDGKPISPTLEFQFPNLSKIHSVVIIPCTANGLNTKLLQFNSCMIDFPDGIYYLKYSVDPADPVFICKSILKTTKLGVRLLALIEGKISNEAALEFYKIDLLIRGAEAIVNTDEKKAVELYKRADKELKKLESDGLCNMW